MGQNAVKLYRLVYIPTRPLGASFGDLMSQPMQYGGLGFSTITTSAIFLAAIVGFMSLRQEGDELTDVDIDGKSATATERGGLATAEEEV
ncbi:hypothetical protein [Rhizobium sp. BR 314]|uniref:hypothetical protein n=1 Tax=Rhizobium sp. BR 314 TaxID=3040013 RepID=UPI0039BEEFFF